MEQDLSYLRTEYAREKMIESYHREEAEKLTAKEVKGKGRDNPPAPEREDYEAKRNRKKERDCRTDF
jgi:hypothetical protein